ncbi:hypothetical protein BDW62DRAFT_85851 [Aspergillus aurantiobrunneus]
MPAAVLQVVLRTSRTARWPWSPSCQADPENVSRSQGVHITMPEQLRSYLSTIPNITRRIISTVLPTTTMKTIYVDA